ncbi:Glutamyl-tRNA(Gln) amidotransferase subunit C mitochondrial, partial [Paragonimus kellicotti]
DFQNSHRSVILNRNRLHQFVNFTRPLLCWNGNFVEFFGLKCALCRHCSSGILRFVPAKPLWMRFDVTLSAEFWPKNETPAGSGLFAISRSALPLRTELQGDDIKLLERLSLTDFGTEKCLTVLEEAIRYADPLLTESAFKGTTNEERWSRNSTVPMYSLVDEIHPEVSCPLRNDEAIVTAELATVLVNQAPLTWEGYYVAPPGNIPVESKGVVRE